ncbi:MAG: DHH family phosphoesterase, partial [Bryobacteraceae bacterium]|nr:DHH family phosphoesterase [Bryobacteraceae bacterium]
PNPGLRALLAVAGLEGKSPSARQVGFQIGPRINAAGRLASARDVVELLLHADATRAQTIAEQLDRLNRERQTIEREMGDSIAEQVVASPVTDEQAALVFAGEGWHKGVVGIVASRVVNRFNRPAFVLGLDPESGLAQGSGRSVPLFHLLESLESMPELFTKFGGHKQAAGLTMPIENVEEFRRRFSAYAAARLSPEDFRPQVALDTELMLEDLGERLFAQLEQLAPFGNENDAPVFLIRGCYVPAAPQIKNEQHVFFHVRQGDRIHRVKAWRFAERAAEIYAGAKLDLAITIERDRFDGWSLTVEDIRPAG